MGYIKSMGEVTIEKIFSCVFVFLFVHTVNYVC